MANGSEIDTPADQSAPENEVFSALESSFSPSEEEHVRAGPAAPAESFSLPRTQVSSDFYKDSPARYRPSRASAQKKSAKDDRKSAKRNRRISQSRPQSLPSHTDTYKTARVLHSNPLRSYALANLPGNRQNSIALFKCLPDAGTNSHSHNQSSLPHTATLNTVTHSQPNMALNYDKSIIPYLGSLTILTPDMGGLGLGKASSPWSAILTPFHSVVPHSQVLDDVGLAEHASQEVDAIIPTAFGPTRVCASGTRLLCSLMA